MLRVAILASEFNGQPTIGGIGTYNWYLAKGLASRHVEVDLITLSEDSKVERLKDNLRVHHVPVSEQFSQRSTEFIPYSGYAIVRSLSLWQYFLNNLDCGSFDCLDVQEHLGLGYMNAYSELLPMVVRLQTPVFLQEVQNQDVRPWVPNPFDLELLKKIESFPIRKAEQLIGASRSFSSLITSAAGVERSVLLQHNPLDLSDFPVKQDYKAEQGKFNWCFIGRLEKRKGAHILIEAMGKALKDNPEMHLTIIGPDTRHGSIVGSTLLELKNRIAQLGISDRISFRGQVEPDSIGRILNEFDGAVVPSEFDNAPYTCLSAMASGLPVIGTDSGGMTEYLGEDEQRGLIVPVREPEKLAQAMVRITRDADLRERFGVNARKFVEANCDHLKIAEKSIEVYGSAKIESFRSETNLNDCRNHLEETFKLLDRFYDIAEKRTTYDLAYKTGLTDGIAHATDRTVFTRAAQKLSSIWPKQNDEGVEPEQISDVSGDSSQSTFTEDKIVQRQVADLENQLATIRKNPFYSLVELSESSKNGFSRLVNGIRRVRKGRNHVSADRVRIAREQLKRSVLFDPQFYLSSLKKLGEHSVSDPIEHYLTVGWKLNISPSPLFDPDYVTKQLDGEVASLCPLLTFLDNWQELTLSPGIMFNTGRYLEMIGGIEVNALDPVSHYLESDFLDQSPSAHFDCHFYSRKYNLELKEKESAWLHFMTRGRFEDRCPNSVFDPGYYRKQLRSLIASEKDALVLYAHYLEEGYKKNLRSYPTFDLAWYQSLLSTDYEGVLGPQEAVEDFLASGYEKRMLSNRALSKKFHEYESKDDSLKERYLNSPYSQDLEIDTWAKIDQFARSDKKALVFLGHQASLTGAPMVLLSIMEYFAREYECFLLLPQGGEILDNFKEISNVVLLDYCPEPEFITRRFMDCLKNSVSEERIVGVIANTAEVLAHQEMIKDSGIPVISIIHELAHGYSEEYFSRLYKASDTMIFSSHFSFELAKEKSVPPKSLKIFVKGQGLLDRTFGKSDVQEARKSIRQVLQIPEDSFVAFSCGSLDLRKGIDFYVKIARNILEKVGDKARPIYFAWIGDGVKYSGTPFYFMEWDMARMNFKDHVRFLTPRKDIEPWFVGADVFLLPSRQDPLPCVVHNSMSCAVPVVAFNDSGGTAELLSDGGGKIVPYGDVESFSDAVLQYYFDEELRLSDGDRARKFAEEELKFSDYYAFIKSKLDDENKERFKNSLPEEEDPFFDENLVIDKKEKIEIAFLEQRLQARLASPSWRLTAPIRKSKQLLKSLSLKKQNLAPLESNQNQRLMANHFSDSRDDYFKYLKGKLAEIRTSFSWKMTRALRLSGKSQSTYDEKKLAVLGRNNKQALRERTRFETIDVNYSQKRI